MTLKIEITGSGKGVNAEVFEPEDGFDKRGLVVYTHPIKEFENKLRFFTSDDYGINLNQNAAFSGVTLGIHNGTDTIYWTATDIVGGDKTTFDNTDQNHTIGGSKSIKIDNSPIGDVFEFNNGSIIDCSNYAAITMWIYVDKDWKEGDSIAFYGWDSSAGSQIGDSVNLEDYFNWGDFNVWHKLAIPLSNFGSLSTSTSLDALRVRIVTSEGKSPKFYIDDIQFEEIGNPIEYKIEPRIGTWLHVVNLNIIFADVYSPIEADSTMPKIPYDSFFGVSNLDTGIVYQRWRDGEIVNSANITQFGDLMNYSNAQLRGYGSDGTTSWLSVVIEFNTPTILKSEDSDKLSLVLTDDLSGLVLFRVSAGCKEETRE